MKSILVESFAQILNSIDFSQSNLLPMFVIYQNPPDLPYPFCARLFFSDHATLYVVAAPSLEEIREKLPPGLFPLPRFKEDDPVIVEVWV